MCWRKSQRNASGIRVLQGPWVTVSLVLLVGCSALLAADKVKDLQDHFDRETHASGKIKTLEKLGQAQFEAASKAGNADDFTTVGLTFEKYRDNARSAFELLKKQEPDSDRHSEGYRHLELQVRRGIREVEETLLVVPDEVRPPLRIVRQDLISLDDTLIHELFPRRTKDPQTNGPAPESKP
jgi:hypothetical protein